MFGHIFSSCRPTWKKSQLKYTRSYTNQAAFTNRRHCMETLFLLDGQCCGDLMFSLLLARRDCWRNSPDAGILRRHCIASARIDNILSIEAGGYKHYRNEQTKCVRHRYGYFLELYYLLICTLCHSSRQFLCWRHDMHGLSALLALCRGIHRWIPIKKGLMRSFVIFFDANLNKLPNKHSGGRWFEVPGRWFDIVVMCV